MKEYLLLFRGGDAKNMQQSPEEWQKHMQKWAKWMGDLTQEGKFVSAQPLSSSGWHVSGSKKVVSDGPYMEGKEMVGGYLICKADSFDAAVKIANGCPILEFDNGDVEVREIQEMTM